MIIKAGYKTSEFWFTLVSFIFSGLYLTGILTENNQKEELISVVSHAVESCILIGGQLLILYRYVKGRQEVKQIVEQEKLKEIEIQEEIVKNEPKRNSKTTSRKTNPTNKRVSRKSKKSSNR
jgi:hypothetical protein